MTTRENLIQSYIKQALRVRKLETKLRRVTRRLTDDEWRRAEIVVNDKHMEWLQAGEPGSEKLEPYVKQLQVQNRRLRGALKWLLGAVPAQSAVWRQARKVARDILAEHPEEEVMHYDLRTKETIEEGIVFIERIGSLPERIFCVYEPGDGTRYAVLLTPLDWSPEAMGRMGVGENTWLVSLMNDPGSVKSFCVTAAPGGYIHYDRAQKVDLGLPSSVTLTELLAHLLKCHCTTRDEFLARMGDTP
jgi:hypothetical protein